MGMKAAMTRAALTGLYRTGAHRLLAPYTQARGVIFTLNQVRPPQEKSFAPNRGLEIAPEFLEAMLDQDRGGWASTSSVSTKRYGASEKTTSGASSASPSTKATATWPATLIPCFDGARCRSPVYVATDYASGWGELWWLALEEVVGKAREIELCRQGGLWRLAQRNRSGEAAKLRADLVSGCAASMRRGSAR